MKLKACLLVLVTLISLALPLGEARAVEGKETIKVGFLSEMKGFYEMEENGGYSGYNCDYLQNLAQYNKWDLEFVEISQGNLSDSMKKAEEMLESGEIDLLGPVAENSGKLENFEYGDNYAVSRYCFYSARNNYLITQENYFLQNTLRVALINGMDEVNDSFLALYQDEIENLEVVYVDSQQECLNLLFTQKVDTMLCLDMSENSQYLDYLTTIDHIPLYFVAKKGNSALISQLDEGIALVEMASQNLHNQLMDAYFGMRYEGEFYFLETELAMLAEIDSLKVGFLKDVPPYQYFDKNGKAMGVSLDIFAKLGEILGIDFEIVWIDQPEDLLTAVAEGKVDILATLPLDYQWSHDFPIVFTDPYLSSGVYWLSSENQVENPEIYYHYVSGNIPFYSDEELTMVMDIEKSMVTMSEKGSISIFCDPHIAEYYLDSLRLQNINVNAVSNVRSDITMGVGSHLDVALIGLLNRGILFLDSHEVDEILYINGKVEAEYSFNDFFRDYSATIFCIFFILAGFIILYILRNSRKFKEMSRRDGMTKLYNSGYFHEYAEDRTKKLDSGSLILIDIDYFKQVNDNYGHHAGDLVIKDVASKLQKYFRANDMVGRLGGDEFGILLEYFCNTAELEQRCRKILEELSSEENDVPVTLSIGGYIFDKNLPYKELYNNADKFLYKVKESGRNSYAFGTERDLKELD